MQRKISVILSVDWEGRDLKEENLKAMDAFRRDFPHIPLQHFLNAAYYTKKNVDVHDACLKIKSVLREGDEHGLHIHSWQSLFLAAGVAPKKSPTLFLKDTKPKIYDGDWGHEVCLDAYNVDELRKVIRFSCMILEEHGFKRPKSFRAGAWLAAHHVFQALYEEGFERDCSAAYVLPLKKRWGDFYLYKRALSLWSGINELSQPYSYQISKEKTMLEIPNNGCLADYVTSSDMLKIFLKNVYLMKEQGGDRVVSFGFHQETAAKFISRLSELIPLMKDAASKHEVALDFCLPA